MQRASPGGGPGAVIRIALLALIATGTPYTPRCFPVRESSGEMRALADQKDPRLADLFERLRNAPDTRTALPIEEAIWRVWLQPTAPETGELLARGVRAMERPDYPAALRAFNAVIEREPDFAEGWNRRATLYYLIGDHPASVRDIERTLALEPRHFGALSGLALILEAEGRPFEALEALEAVVQIHPQLSHLDERVDRLTRQLGDPI